jgi:hypothetical protein
LELFNNLKETFMNKLIATLIVGAFSAAAFAVTPAAPATPATPASAAAAKADTVPAVKAEKAEGKHLGKAKHEAKKAEAAAPKADAVK